MISVSLTSLGTSVHDTGIVICFGAHLSVSLLTTAPRSPSPATVLLPSPFQCILAVPHYCAGLPLFPRDLQFHLRQIPVLLSKALLGATVSPTQTTQSLKRGTPARKKEFVRNNTAELLRWPRPLGIRSTRGRQRRSPRR